MCLARSSDRREFVQFGEKRVGEVGWFGEVRGDAMRAGVSGRGVGLHRICLAKSCVGRKKKREENRRRSARGQIEQQEKGRRRRVLARGDKAQQRVSGEGEGIAGSLDGRQFSRREKGPSPAGHEMEKQEKSHGLERRGDSLAGLSE